MRVVTSCVARGASRTLRALLPPPSAAAAAPVLSRPVLAGVRWGARTTAAWHGTEAMHVRGFAATDGSEEKPHAQTEAETAKAGAAAEEEEEAAAVAEAEQSDREQLLSAALTHVPRLGWSVQALWAGAEDVGVSAAAVGILPRGEAMLVEWHEHCCTAAVIRRLANEQPLLAEMPEAERIQAALRMRLELTIPYVSSWPQALAVQAQQPANMMEALRQRAILMDELCHGVGLTSADLSWYGHRALMGAVYTSTELFLLTDGSPQFADTWRFLDRATQAALEARKHSGHAGEQLAQVMGTLGERFSHLAQTASAKRYP